MDVNIEPGDPPSRAGHERHEQAAQFFDLTGDILAVLDARGAIVEANDAFAKVCEKEAVSLRQTLISDIMRATDPTEFPAQNSLLDPANPRVDFEWDARIGDRRMTLVVSLDLDVPTGNRFFVARDISEQRRLRAQLEKRANQDELAGLNNRDGFNDALALELKLGEDVAVIKVLIDGIDVVTAEHGERVMAQLVQAAVSRMRRNLRDSDMMARFGTGEFAIMLTGVNVRESAERLGAQLAESLRRAFGVKGARVDVVSAVGIAIGKPSTHTPDQLIQEAGKALQEARRNGFTSAVVFGQTGLATLAASARGDTELLNALANADDYGVELQGIFTADGKGSIGVEALLSKNLRAAPGMSDDSVHEVLPAITLETATEVFDQIGAWLSAHRSRRICVNIASPQLASADLFVGLAAAAKMHHLDTRQIVCELSEATLGDGAVSPHRMTEEIRRHGFQLTIDNFGTETASLANLRGLDATYVKLDSTLVTNLFTSEFHSAIIRSVVDVARTMGIAVIANGVENQQQLEAVRSLGCAFVQGPGVHAAEPLNLFAGRVI